MHLNTVEPQMDYEQDLAAEASGVDPLGFAERYGTAEAVP